MQVKGEYLDTAFIDIYRIQKKRRSIIFNRESFLGLCTLEHPFLVLSLRACNYSFGNHRRKLPRKRPRLHGLRTRQQPSSEPPPIATPGTPSQRKAELSQEPHCHRASAKKEWIHGGHFPGRRPRPLRRIYRVRQSTTGQRFHRRPERLDRFSTPYQLLRFHVPEHLDTELIGRIQRKKTLIRKLFEE